MHLLPFTPWHWLGIAVLLLIFEVLVSGGFLLWVGISALLVSFVSWIYPISWTIQMISFSALAILTCLCWWGYLQKRPIKSNDPTLNRRAEQYIGRTFELIQAIENGRGKIHVEDSTWTVKGEDLPRGTKVKIIRAEGTILIAEKAD
jgi:membrane protein implicated in regulation of membrane protease activity